jgi:hypothetical protein
MEYDTAENTPYSKSPAGAEVAVTNDITITCDAQSTSDVVPESREIPRNIPGGTGVSPVSLPQSNGGSVASGKMADWTVPGGDLAGNSALQVCVTDTLRYLASCPCPPLFWGCRNLFLTSQPHAPPCALR